MEETNKKLRKEKKALDRDNKNAKDLEYQVIALSTKVEKETKRADDWRERHGKAQYAIQADDPLWKKAFRTMKRKHNNYVKSMQERAEQDPNAVLSVSAALDLAGQQREPAKPRRQRRQLRCKRQKRNCRR